MGNRFHGDEWHQHAAGQGGFGRYVVFTDAEARQFLVGPAYFAWEWMQNIEGHDGPLPKAWIDSHIELGKQVLSRERAFGMTPVQQGFSGHVPRAFLEKFPKARIRRQPSWCGFPGVAQLDPIDPLFAQFGRIFMEEEATLYGLGGYYAADPFHESKPPSDISEEEMPKYLNSVGHNIHALLDGIDPESQWVMQSWSIRKEIATAVPKGRLLVLDLAGEKWQTTEGFWGHHFCVGQLHNFGGRINLHGDLAHVATNPFVAAKKLYPATAAGTGIFMEGIVQNPVFYDLYFDMTWREGAVAMEEWLREYALRRYGVEAGATNEAWKLLLAGPYREKTSGVESSSIIAARPALNCKKSGPNAGFIMVYSPKELVEAWTLLLSEQKRCGEAEGYRFDVMDVGRQVLSNLAQVAQKDAANAFAARDKAAFQKAVAQFTELLLDTDRLCETRGEYRFGDWLGAARKWGTNADDVALYDKNASMLVTCWGPEDTPRIFDYSWREWSGLIRTFYLPRWQRFFSMLTDKLDKNESYSEAGLPQVYGREAWRANSFYSALADWEMNWITTPKKNWQKLDVGNGDEISCANEMHAKWKPVLDAAYAGAQGKKA
jgi:alpha-N-acetylglucosaminidase